MKTQIKRLLGLLMAMVMVFTMLPVGIIAGAAETEEVYYLLEEEFDDASVLGTKWTYNVANVNNGRNTYAIANGQLITTSNNANGYPVITYADGYDWTDYEFTTTLETAGTAPEGESYGGWNRVDFRVSADGKQFYSLYWMNNRLYIRKYVESKYYASSAKVLNSQNEPYVVNVQVKNIEGGVQVDVVVMSGETTVITWSWQDLGTLTVGTATNTAPYLSGSVGFGQQQGAADTVRSKHYDYMIVKDLRERAKVTFNVNGTETTQSVAVGETPVAPEVTETVRFDAEGNRYTFTGWDKELAAVESTDPVTYTAQYDKDQLLVDESFGSEDALKNWNFTGGTGTTLAVADGKLVLTSGDSQGYAYYKYGYNWADYEFTATYDTNNTWSGPVFRVSEDGNSYYAVMLLNSSAQVRKYTGNQYTTLTSFGFTNNSTFDMTVKVVGNQMSFYVDGVLKGSCTDATYATGSIGFYGIANEISYFDNIKVYNLGADVELHVCADENKDHVCDNGCDVPQGEHVAAAGKHTCDYCGLAADEGCVDGDDANHTCDVCGELVDGDVCVDGDDKDHNCDECGAENVSEHVYVDGYCACDAKDPNAKFVAQVGNKDYVSLQAAVNAGGNVTLLDNVTLTEMVTISSSLTLDLAGKTITSAVEDSVAVRINGAGIAVTITGNGAIISNGTAVHVMNGTATIENGTYTSTYVTGGFKNAALYVGNEADGNNGAAIINGGTFNGSTGHAFALRCCDGILTVNAGTINGANNACCTGVMNIKGGSFSSNDIWSETEKDILYVENPSCNCGLGVINVTGGTFAGQNPANASISSSATTNYVAEGYTVEEADGVYTVKELIESAGTTTRFGDELSIIVGYAPEEIGNPIEKGLVAKLVKKDGTKVDLTNWAVDTKTGYWTVELTGISAKEIADQVTIVITDGETNVTKTESISLRDYAVRVLKNPEQTDAYKTAIMDMLNYGAAAQAKFNYNTGNPANAGLEDYQKYATEEMTAVTNIRETAIGGDFGGSSLRFNDAINIMFQFKISLDTYAEFTWKDHTGEDHTVTVNSADYQVNGEYYVVELKNQLVVADARVAVTCTIKNTADDTTVIAVTDSVSSNVARVSATNKALYESFMMYADATKVYLDSKNQ